MRPLIMSDVYKMSRILAKMKLKLNTKGKEQEEVGTDLILSITENLHHAEQEVNDFLGGLIGVTGEEFGNLGLLESRKYIEEFKNLEGVQDFLLQVGWLMKRK